MDGLMYLFAAFTAVWIVLFFYMFGISRKQQTLRRDMDALKAHLESKDTEEP